MRKTSVLLFILLLGPIGLWASVDSSEIHSLAPTEVQTAHFASDALSPLVLLPKEWEGRGLSLADILATHAGIQTRRMGGMGSLQNISIRGVAGSKVLICVDGIPLGNVHGGMVDLGQIDLQQVERIEVQKGFVPAEYGGNGIGGVVQIITRQNPQTGGQVELRMGSFDQREYSLLAQGSLQDSARFSGSLSFRRSDNDYSYLDRNGTPYNSTDDEMRTRSNAQYQQLSGAYQWSRLYAPGELRLQLSHSRNEGGLAGAESEDTKTAGFSQDWVAPRLQWQGTRYGVLAEFRYGLDEFHWSNALDGLGYGNALTDYSQAGTQQLRLDVQASLYSSPHAWPWELHLQGLAEQLQPQDFPRNIQNWVVQRHKLVLASQMNHRFFSWWNVQGNAQMAGLTDHQRAGILQSNFKLQLGNSERWQGDGALQGMMLWGKEDADWQLRLLGGHHYRFPELRERFSTYLGVLPNPNLKTEQGESIEFSLHYQKKTFQSSVALFANWQRDGIVWVRSAGFAKAVNLEATEVQGLEWEMKWKPLANLQWQGNATWQRALNTSAIAAYQGKRLPNEAELVLQSSLTWKIWQWEWFANGKYQSEVFRDEANTMRIAPQWSADIYLAHPLWNRARVQVGLRNIAGAEWQDVYSAYPTPGRHWTVSLQQKF